MVSCYVAWAGPKFLDSRDPLSLSHFSVPSSTQLCMTVFHKTLLRYNLQTIKLAHYRKEQFDYLCVCVCVCVCVRYWAELRAYTLSHSTFL
jgi:hypothetical protein